MDNEDTLSDDAERKGSVKRIKLSKNAKDNKKRLIVVIDNAYLIPHRIEKTGDKYELLNAEHIEPDAITKKIKFQGKYNQYLTVRHKIRPDLVHQCLLMLFDSPLNHAELLQVYVRTHDGTLIQIHRETRMPRTYKRFSHLLANFLVEGSLPQVTTKDGPINLMRILESPISKQIPPGSTKYKIVNYDEDLPVERLSKIVDGSAGVSQSDPTSASHVDGSDIKSDKIKRREVPVVVYIDAVPTELNIIQNPAASTLIKANREKRPALESDTKCCCISQYPLTPTHICVKLASAFEKFWNIL